MIDAQVMVKFGSKLTQYKSSQFVLRNQQKFILSKKGATF